MAHFAKPAAGSWTEQYPELGTGPVSYEDSISPGVLRGRARGDLPPLVAERRPRRAAPPQGQLLHQGARRRPHVGRSSCGAPTARCAPSTTSAATAATSSCGPTTRRRRSTAPAASSPASTTAGATTSRATSPSCSRSRSSSTSTRPTTASCPCRCEVWAGLHLRAPRPRQHRVGRVVPRRAGRRHRGLPVRRDDRRCTSTGPTSEPTGSSSSTPSPSSTTHLSCTRSKPCRTSRASSRASASRRSPTTSTVRTAWCRRGAACRRPRTSTWSSRSSGCCAAACSARGTSPTSASTSCPPGLNPARAQGVGHRLVRVLPELHAAGLGAELVPHVPLLADGLQPPHLRGHALLRAAEERDASASRQELAAVTFKEYALQDGNTLEATQRSIESRAVTAFPLNDQEILLRHLHKTARDRVAEYQARQGETPVQHLGRIVEHRRPPPRVRRPRAVRRLVARDRGRALRQAARQHDGRDAGVLRRRLPSPRGGDGLPRRACRSTRSPRTPPACCGSATRSSTPRSRSRCGASPACPTAARPAWTWSSSRPSEREIGSFEREPSFYRSSGRVYAMSRTPPPRAPRRPGASWPSPARSIPPGRGPRSGCSGSSTPPSS